MGFPSSHNGYVIQRVQVSYVAHVTPIPENLDSYEAASFLCAVRMSYCSVTTANIDNHMYRVSLYTARWSTAKQSQATGLYFLELAAASDILVRTTVNHFFPYLTFAFF
jgi:hypothetical protein